MAEKFPTAETIAEDLNFANDFAEDFGYGFKDGHLIVEVYSDSGDIEKTYKVTMTFEEIN